MLALKAVFARWNCFLVNGWAVDSRRRTNQKPTWGGRVSAKVVKEARGLRCIAERCNWGFGDVAFQICNRCWLYLQGKNKLFSNYYDFVALNGLLLAVSDKHFQSYLVHRIRERSGDS